MTWTSAGSIQISRDWQYTEPIASGTYFRLKHTEAKNGALFAIAQCELDADGKLSIGDSQILAVEKEVDDIVKLPKSAYADRRIAIKRIISQPSLEQELRRLILPNLLTSLQEEINYIKRNNWTVDIEVSDYIDTVANTNIDYSSNFEQINTRFNNIDSALIAIEESIGQSSAPSGSTKQLTFVSNGDANGVCYWLGTNYGAQAWSNPHTAGRVTVSKSANIGGNFDFVERMVDRVSNEVLTADTSNSWIQIDLGAKNTLEVNYYSLQGRDGSFDANYLRNWKLQGSNDNVNWIDINTQSNNNTHQRGVWVSIPVPNQTTSYRFLRILQTGLNSDNNNYLALSEFEFYGKLITQP